MEFWCIWIVSWILVAITATVIRKSKNPDQLWIYGLVSLCIITVGGITCAKWFAMMLTIPINDIITFVSDLSSFEKIFGVIGTILTVLLVILVPLFFTYLAGHGILGLHYIENWKAQVAFVAIFIVSVIGWTIPIYYYNLNIETTIESEITEQSSRELLYFCNIPVQSVSGEIEGSSVLGTGSVSGSITTQDLLPYWYMNANGKGAYDSAPATASQIEFIGEDEQPHLEIITYVQKSITHNYNNGEESSKIEATWTEYVFYLPEFIMQYNLN